MIRFGIRRDACRRIVCLSCLGHAGFDNEGCDIVCAGVSAVCGALITGLTQVVGASVYVTARNGGVFLRVPPEVGGRMAEDVHLLTETAWLALLGLAEGYPGFVRRVRLRHYRGYPLWRGPVLPVDKGMLRVRHSRGDRRLSSIWLDGE